MCFSSCIYFFTHNLWRSLLLIYRFLDISLYFSGFSLQRILILILFFSLLFCNERFFLSLQFLQSASISFVLLYTHRQHAIYTVIRNKGLSTLTNICLSNHWEAKWRYSQASSISHAVDIHLIALPLSWREMFVSRGIPLKNASLNQYFPVL